MNISDLHILLVEDTTSDAELIKRQIHKIDKDIQTQVVDNLSDLKVTIATFNPQIILSDYNLPTCTGMDVLKVARENSPSATFVFLTGTLQDEELAAETILNGADGFILKKHINDLVSRLKPFIEKVRNKPNIVQDAQNRIKKSSDLISNIKEYMENINNENMTHQERLDKIRLHLDNIKKSL
ncbi:response regulator [Dokdonia sp. Hel_I_53]|uniref:response regulator n=1 Tax=Dokdonia sp. Hel_I_53 TaxID=1566287 RepID=UPI001199DC47|nr:response regulator [Dokdonia sp. Hel_I_53]TVZ53327.1 CheY-like chemotaxis protein [Dokdonia sp. Hel_I_53]